MGRENMKKFIVGICSVLFSFALFPSAHADCNPGCYVSGTTCQPCAIGTWSAGGATTSCTACPAGQTGNIPTGASSCVAYKTLKSSTGRTATLRATKISTPSLCVKDATATYYGNLSSTISGYFKFNYLGTVYNVVDPTGLAAANCGTPPFGGPGQEGEPFRVHFTSGDSGVNASSFGLGAAGNFTIDWGDDTTPQVINKSNTTLTEYSHTYTVKGDYVMTISGKATEYSTDTSFTGAAISFASCSIMGGCYQGRPIPITFMSGDLGSVFPILNNTDAGKPKFIGTFGVGVMVKGPIPPNLFAGLHGAPGPYMFASLFAAGSGGTTQITGSIPENLFAGINGPPAPYMFSNTFFECKNLTGPIPGNLFSGISGDAAQSAFQATFKTCPGLTGIGDGLFDGITGAATTLLANMFNSTFNGCTGLTGLSATSDGQFLYDKWPNALTGLSTNSCYTGATGLSDYASVPTQWR